MPMTQKKENSTKSRNGEFRVEAIFSGILIFIKLQINRFNFLESLFWFSSSREFINYSFIRKGKFLLIGRKYEQLDYEDIDSGTQFQSIPKAMNYLEIIQLIRIRDV